MSVEQAQTVDQLNISLPRNVDLIREGDDHIRLIKSALKNTFPNIKGVVNFPSEKLNNLNTSIDSVDKEGNLTLSKSLTMKRGSSVNMNDARIQFVGDPVDEGDAVNFKYFMKIMKEIDNPIGTIKIYTTDIDPNKLYGFGKWVKTSEGRCLLGSGISADLWGHREEFKNGTEGGLYEQKLELANLPKHKFTVTGKTDYQGRHDHNVKFPYNKMGNRAADTQNTTPTKWDRSAVEEEYGTGRMTPGNWTSSTFKEAADHLHTVTGETNEIGEQKVFSILPPYLVVNIWERVE